MVQRLSWRRRISAFWACVSLRRLGALISLASRRFLPLAARRYSCTSFGCIVQASPSTTLGGKKSHAREQETVRPSRSTPAGGRSEERRVGKDGGRRGGR